MRHLLQCLQKIITLMFFGTIITYTVYSQDTRTGVKNVVGIDLNPEITSLFFLPMDVTGFGLTVGYERVLTRRFSIKSDVKYLWLSMSGVSFSYLDTGLHGRYFPLETAPAKLFVDIRLGPSFYESPFRKGWAFNVGIDIGWKYIIKSHFFIEPYFGCDASTIDKFNMPFTIAVISEFIVPGFHMGVSWGVVF